MAEETLMEIREYHHYHRTCFAWRYLQGISIYDMRRVMTADWRNALAKMKNPKSRNAPGLAVGAPTRGS